MSKIETYDVIVVGSGSGGALAALRAIELGLSVLIIEKAHKYGGTSATSGGVQIKVTDNGAGIRPEHMTRIFSHGFTTKADGHGFGLHSGALAARDLGGALRVDSAGPGHGATFTLDLPLKSPETVYG